MGEPGVFVEGEVLRQRIAEIADVAVGRGATFRRLDALLRSAELGRPVLSRSFFGPGHFTASGLVLSPDSQALLLIFHKKLRLWLQPGGHFETGDADWVQAARREVHEETGVGDCEVISALWDVDVHEIPPHGREPSHLHHDLRCLLRAKSAQLLPSDEVAEARWFPLSQVVDREGGLQTDESVRRAARRLNAAQASSTIA